jgi:hypothetical protein
MAHDFEIRFARSAGLAGLLEAPANPFRWKGSGRISVDAKGISIAVRRGFFRLFGVSTRRIAVGQLTDVYREGESVRLEFSTADASRSALSFWARSSDDAAHIVNLLPTPRTVEFDEELAMRKFRLDRPLVWAALALIGIAVGLVAVRSISTSRTMEQEPPLPMAEVTPGAAPANSINDSAIEAAPAVGTTKPRQRDQVSRTQAATAPGVRQSTREPTQAAEVLDSRAGEVPASEADSTEEGYALNPAAPVVPPEGRQLTGLLADLHALHADCLERRACSEKRWWDFTVQLYEIDSVFALREQYAAVSRCWRGYLEGGPSADFDRALAIRLMNNLSSWGY